MEKEQWNSNTETVLIGLAVTVLAGCGGGGGSPSTAVTTATWPNSGNFEVVLKPSGLTTASALQTALSLVHPAYPDTEFVFDATAASSTVSVGLQQGQYNATTGQFTNLQNVAYVDDRNGNLRVTSLVASGARPTPLTQPIPTLCKSNSVEARSFTQPFASQLVVGTAGTDGLCSTSDDGQLLIKFSQTGAPSMSTPSGFRYLGYFRSSATGEPSHWLDAADNGATRLTSMADPTVVTNVGAGITGSTATSTAVGNLSDLVLYSRNGVLNAVRMVNGVPSASSVSAVTGTSGWQMAGNDAANAYLYLSSGASASCAGTWRITSVSRSAATASTLATGVGSLVAATVFGGAVYATTCLGSSMSVIKVDTQNGSQSAFTPSTSSTSYVAMALSNTLIVQGISSSTGNYSLQFFNSAGGLTYDAGNAMAWGVNQASYDIVSNRFNGDAVYVLPQTVIAGAGGTLRRWDVASSTMRDVGTLPSAVDLGGSATDTVYVNPLALGPQIGGTTVARITGGQFQSTGSRVYTLQSNATSNLTLTNKTVQ